MNISSIFSSRLYPVAVGLAAAGVGVGVGFLVDYLTGDAEADEGPGEVREEAVQEPQRKPKERILHEKKVGAAFEKPPLTDYTKYAKAHPIGGDDDGDRTEENTEKVDASMFEIISEEEFVAATGNPDGYVTATGTYFPEDGILAGWNNDFEPKDVAGTIGEAAAGMFADEEVAAVYVRNNGLKVLYEILRGDGAFELQEEEG